MRNLVAAKRGIVLALCGYECAAVATGRVPTITTLSGRYRALAPALVLALAVHLAWNPRPRVIVVPVTADCALCPEPF